MFKKRKYRLPLWLRRVRDAFYQFLIPLTVFQLFRTLILPTAGDVLVLFILVVLYFSYSVGWF